MKFFIAEVDRIEPQFLRHDVHCPFDRISDFGDTERAAIGDAAWRLVGVDAVDRQVRDREVIRTRNDIGEACRPFRRVGAGVERAVIGQDMHAQAHHSALARRGDLSRHVIVAGERGGGEVLDPVLDPFDRDPGHDRGDRGADVSRIGADLVAEAAPNVRRDDVDLLLGQTRDQRDDGADDMGRLEGAVDREVAGDLVEADHALAGFQGTGVDALVAQQVLGLNLSLHEGGVSQLLIADLPIEDVVGMVARPVGPVLFVLDVLAKDGSALIHRLERVDDVRGALHTRPRPGPRRRRRHSGRSRQRTRSPDSGTGPCRRRAPSGRRPRASASRRD